MRRTAFNLMILFVLLSSFLMAQKPASYNSADIYLKIKKLGVLGSVLYIAAHPDDENSRLIAYLAKDRLYRTGYLSMTRGDGGQNLIGDEQGVELGLIRTQEMLAARRIDGAEQFFTRAYDFGFTKTTDEALKTWEKEKILSDVVWVIRKFQPDVIITRFPEDGRAGHGHHSASAVLAHEAFSAAADPNFFPEQFRFGVSTWQAKRLLWNTFNFGSTNTTSEDQMKIDVGVYNPVLGKSYGEIAAESRTQHKSQGAALTPARGQAMEYFTIVAGESAKSDPLEGIVTSWNKIDGAGKVQAKIDDLAQHYSLMNPERSVPALVDLYRAISNLKDGYWKAQKLKEVQTLIEACSGLWLEATVRGPYAVQGDSISVTFVINNRLNADINLSKIRLNSFDTLLNQQLLFNKNYSVAKTIYISQRKQVSQPYWLAEEMSPGSFNVRDQQLIGEPQGPPAYEAAFELSVQGQNFVFTRPVLFKFTDPVKGELYQPLTVVPAITGQFDPELLLFTDGEQKPFTVQTKTMGRFDSALKTTLTHNPDLSVSLVGNSHNNIFSYSAKPAEKNRAVQFTYLVYEGKSGLDSAKQLRTISYDHIPRIDYFVPTRQKVVMADVRTAGKKIGYIEGAGDKVPMALQQMGFEVTLLKEKDITAAALQQFDAVITGVRAYDVHEWMTGKYEILMDYIKAGGNLIVQYNRNNAIGNMKIKIGPYPFTISNSRVTDENATVRFLNPNHAVLNYPNKISEADFQGWVQERGIYFLSQLDQNYESIFAMHDAGEPDQTGSLVIGNFGKGKFVYTGLVFFRELPAGVPGAYRLLANIIALNQRKGF